MSVRLLFAPLSFAFLCLMPLSAMAQDPFPSQPDAATAAPESILDRPSAEPVRPLPPASVPGRSAPADLEGTSVPDPPPASEELPRTSPTASPPRFQDRPFPTSAAPAMEETRVLEPASEAAPTPLGSPTGPSPRAPGSIVEESLRTPKPLSPLSSPPRRSVAVELEATKVSQPQPIIEPDDMEKLIIALLVLSLLGNVFQSYRQRVYGNTLSNQMEAAFNSVAWLLARCMGKTKELSERDSEQKGEGTALLKEFREFSLNSEFTLRALHEQLVVVARSLKQKDRRWKTGQFGYTAEEVEKIRGTFAERPVSDF